MPEGERIQERLDNIRTVQPIVNALRTISLGSWQAALKRRRRLQRYAAHLQEMLSLLVPHLPPGRGGWWPFRRGGARGSTDADGRAVVLVVGTERGLCGGFNDQVVERARKYLAERSEAELWVLGRRIERLFSRMEEEPAWSGGLATSALPPFSLALSLTQRWLSSYEERTLDAVHLVYNTYRGVGQYEAIVERVIPPEPPPSEGGRDAALPVHVIVETDPLALYVRVVEQWAALHLYSLLLDSATAEHGARYQLMEGASQNAERLIEELTAELQALRRQQITREMQELAAGAGLLRTDEGDVP
ncbi:MAG: F0F1 ATP synthase subunit gamma [Anaerolineae bacterium]